MSRTTTGPYSPYLLQPHRRLRIACEQISKAHDLVATPCGACSVRDLCKAGVRRNAMAVPRPREPTARKAVG